ncbi:MAG: CHAT domain-containing protein [Rhodocyclales bacterium]|nr:CHAT domain-containing protein [Rhodocyclales bacterium]
MNAAKLCVVTILMLGVSAAQAQAQTATAIPPVAPEALRAVVSAAKPPPPTIADLVLLLQSYKPDLEKVKRSRAELDAPVSDTTDVVDNARAWHNKALVAEELADNGRRFAALEKALEYAKKSTGSGAVNDVGTLLRIRQDLCGATYSSKGLSAGIDASEAFIRDFEGSAPGAVITMKAALSMYYVSLGNPEKAKVLIAEAESLVQRLRNSRFGPFYYATWTTFIERSKGIMLLAQGRPEEAERAFLAAVRMAEENIKANALNRSAGRFSTLPERAEQFRDMARRDLAHAYMAEERLDEAELLLREVLKASLNRDGRNSRLVGITLVSLAQVFVNRGRFAEAVVLGEWADRALFEAGLPPGSLERLRTRTFLASILTVVGRYAEAVPIFDELRKLAAEEAKGDNDLSVATGNSIRAYISANRLNDALADGDRLLRDASRNYGDDHYTTAEARAYRAMAVQRIGRLDEARKEFERAVNVVIDPAKTPGKQQASQSRLSRLKLILNEYLTVLVGRKGERTARDIAEAFRIADVARWQSVQKAISGSALRAAAGTPELGVRIKKVQDNEDELQAVYKNLIAQRSAPPDKQLPVVIAAMEKRITALQKEQVETLVEIRREFPQYDALVSPRSADLATARKALLPNEALLSVYVTPGGSYVWATGTDGALHFHFSPQTAAWVAGMVKRLRNSVDLSSAISTEKMPFDLEAGSALYQELLAPVQVAWEKADTLLVVANESLGQIPFSLLPTEAVAPGKAEAGLPLSQFRRTPWLARKLAVAYVPSISALVTLRALPAIKGQRDPFIGFGDPDFGAHADKPMASPGGNRSASRGARPRGTRNLMVSRAPKWDENITSADAIPVAPAAEQGAPLLMPLPDTRDEIMAIGTALAANMQRDTFFGDRANRKNVLEADLKRHRVVAFATHGLVAGDLPGLDQPALALAPQAGKGIEDGLLKLEDILKLSLDADLVVLSACNTAAADGSGAEAVSGLGRGFFYAGARAVLATHWPVETVSARELVTHLFERYAKDGKLTRAKALRQAMLEMIDKGMALDERGKPEYSYAHPAFWAPYALYGDPGR